MKNIFAVFTRNWWLKLLAFILALAVFYGVRGSFGTRTTVTPASFIGDKPHANR